MAAETKVITTEEMTRIRERDFATLFGENINGLLNMLKVTRRVEAVAGTVLKVRNVTGTLENGDVDEGDVIPLSQYETADTPIGELSLKKWRKATTAEAIEKSGYAHAVNETNAKALKDVQKTIRQDFVNFLNTATGSISATGTGLQAALADGWGKMQVAYEDDDITPVYFLNPEDVASYLGTANIVAQTSFGFTYIENFLNLGTVIMSPRITKGTYRATAAENLIAYYVNVNQANGLGDAFNFTTDPETGFIGVHEEPNYTRMQEETVMVAGVQILAEYPAGIVAGTITSAVSDDTKPEEP